MTIWKPVIRQFQNKFFYVFVESINPKIAWYCLSANESYKAKNDGYKPSLRHPAFYRGYNRSLNRRMGLHPRE